MSRKAEMLYSYLTLSIKETPVILRTIDDRPYGSRYMLRVLVTPNG